MVAISSCCCFSLARLWLFLSAWTSSWDLHWVAGQELPEFYCQDNRQ